MKVVTDPELIARLKKQSLEKQKETKTRTEEQSVLRELERTENVYETAVPWALGFGSVTLLALIYALVKYAKRKGVAFSRKWLIFTLSVVSLPGYYSLLASRDNDWLAVFVFSLPLIVYLTYIASDLLDKWITKQSMND